MALRFDVGRIDAPQRTPQGGLRAPAFLTRSGVFRYTQDDGKSVAEFRPAEEVFKADSLATLSSAPVTLHHPSSPVSPTNFRALAVGHVSDGARADGEFVAAHVVIQDESAIRAVERGDMRELSCGYSCRIDETPGTSPSGEKYDRIQRDIFYNHVALVPRGRAGSDVALRLDSAGDAVSPILEKSMHKERIEGVDYDVGTDAHKAAVERRDAAEKSRKSDIEKMQARADGAEADAKKLRDQLAAASDPKSIDSLVKARSALFSAALNVLGEEFKADEMSDVDIKKAVIAKLRPELKLDGKSVDYLDASFDTAILSFRADEHAGAHRSLRAAAEGTAKDGVPIVERDDEDLEERVDVDESYQKMVKRGRNAWKKPIPGAYTRSDGE